MSKDLLPSSASSHERALSLATARTGEVATPLRSVWDADTCPAELLPWLAWAFGVDEWDAGWPEEAKRETIRTAILVQQRKGTIWSIKRAISAAGYGDSSLVEGEDAIPAEHTVPWPQETHWALYAFTLTRPISNAQAAQVRRILSLVAPARCHLVALNFEQASHLYNNRITYNGDYNHGVA
ncbi:phage tail protein I (plasmid) [Roseomonas marmotae]|uniref:phage tail protein I n=1 Tax=Roseomonas marmotae TaxID=2768161 RepID=UPI001AD6884A|nr:phage tail protein I [Roseomonas marmotae]QTI81498.1 phage tail protein I [Roseomonas marmotae]